LVFVSNYRLSALLLNNDYLLVSLAKVGHGNYSLRSGAPRDALALDTASLTLRPKRSGRQAASFSRSIL